MNKTKKVYPLFADETNSQKASFGGKCSAKGAGERAFA